MYIEVARLVFARSSTLIVLWSGSSTAAIQNLMLGSQAKRTLEPKRPPIFSEEKRSNDVVMSTSKCTITFEVKLKTQKQIVSKDKLSWLRPPIFRQRNRTLIPGMKAFLPLKRVRILSLFTFCKLKGVNFKINYSNIKIVMKISIMKAFMWHFILGNLITWTIDNICWIVNILLTSIVLFA